MNFYIANGKNKIKSYKLNDFDVEGRVIGELDKVTIARKEECIGGSKNKLFFDGEDVYFMTFSHKEYLGWRQISNFGIAGHGCDHIYGETYAYHYIKNFLLPELAGAIQGYYAARKLDIPRARACLSRIGECLKCNTIDILLMQDILDSLKIADTKIFTKLDEFAYFDLVNNRYATKNDLLTYQENIKGLKIRDLLFPYSKDNWSNVVHLLRCDLAKSEKVQELLDFMPEIEAKRRELSTAYTRCRKREEFPELYL